MADILPISSLLWESNRKDIRFRKVCLKCSQRSSGAYLLIITHNFSNRHKICPSSYLFPSIIKKFYNFIAEFSIKNSCGKSSIQRYQQLLRDLNKRSPFCNIQSKSKESHMLVDLNNVQQTDISDIHEHCTPLNIS